MSKSLSAIQITYFLAGREDDREMSKSTINEYSVHILAEK
jgi:hypothetical protein